MIVHRIIITTKKGRSSVIKAYLNHRSGDLVVLKFFSNLDLTDAFDPVISSYKNKFSY